MKLSILVLVSSMIASVGCVSGSVSAPACDTQSVSIPLPPLPSGNIPPGLTFDIPALDSPPFSEDFSSTLNKVSDAVSSVQVVVSSLTLDNKTGYLSWAKSITVYVQGSDTVKTPKAVLATYTASPDVGQTLSVDVTMDSDTLLTYLESGVVLFTIELGATQINSQTVEFLQGAHGSLSTSVNLCIVATGSESKSL